MNSHGNKSKEVLKKPLPIFFQESKSQKEEEEQEKHIKQYLYHIALITHYKLALQCFFYAFCKCG